MHTSPAQRPGNMRHILVRPIVALSVALFSVAAATPAISSVIASTATSTATSAPAQAGRSPLIITLPARGRAKVLVGGFCLNRGLPFPGEVLNFSEAVPDEVQVAIAYALEQGLKKEDLYGYQLGIWSLVNGPNPRGFARNAKDTRTAVALEAAVKKDAVAASIPADAVALSDAVKAGAVQATVLGFREAAGFGDFYGNGTLRLINTTDKDIRLALPYGSRFKDELTTGVQTMGIFPLVEDVAIEAPLVGPAGPAGAAGPAGPSARWPAGQHRRNWCTRPSR